MKRRAGPNCLVQFSMVPAYPLHPSNRTPRQGAVVKPAQLREESEGYQFGYGLLPDDLY